MRTKEDKDDFQCAQKRRKASVSGEILVCVDVSMLFAATAHSEAGSKSVTKLQAPREHQKFLSNKFCLHLALNLQFGHELTLLLSEILLCFLSFSVIISFVLVSSPKVLVLIVSLCLPCNSKHKLAVREKKEGEKKFCFVAMSFWRHRRVPEEEKGEKVVPWWKNFVEENPVKRRKKNRWAD